MITLKTLLDQLQETYSCRIKNEYDMERFVSRIDMLRPDTVLCEDTLYLCSDDVPGKIADNKNEQAPILLMDANQNITSNESFFFHLTKRMKFYVHQLSLQGNLNI